MNRALMGLTFLAFLTASGCCRLRPDSKAVEARPRTYSSFDRPASAGRVFPARTIRFEEAELGQVLAMYAEVSGRSVIRGADLPEVKLTFTNQSPMGRVEVLRALDTVLAAQGVTAVYQGSQYVKVVPAKDATKEPGPIVELPPDQLPDSSSFLIYVVRLKRLDHSRAAAALVQFAKLPNSIIAMGSRGANGDPSKRGLPDLPAIGGATDPSILILRDYSSNVRRMLQVLQKLEAE